MEITQNPSLYLQGFIVALMVAMITYLVATGDNILMRGPEVRAFALSVSGCVTAITVLASVCLVANIVKVLNSYTNAQLMESDVILKQFEYFCNDAYLGFAYIGVGALLTFGASWLVDNGKLFYKQGNLTRSICILTLPSALAVFIGSLAYAMEMAGLVIR